MLCGVKKPGREIGESTKIGTRVRNVNINCMQLVVMVYHSYTCSAFDIDGICQGCYNGCDLKNRPDALTTMILQNL